MWYKRQQIIQHASTVEKHSVKPLHLAYFLGGVFVRRVVYTGNKNTPAQWAHPDSESSLSVRNLAMFLKSTTLILFEFFPYSVDVTNQPSAA